MASCGESKYLQVSYLQSKYILWPSCMSIISMPPQKLIGKLNEIRDFECLHWYGENLRERT